MRTKAIITQERINAIAAELCQSNGVCQDHTPASLAELLDLCPEQDVWMYEADPSDSSETRMYATFRMVATNGILFHMSCLINQDSEVLEWIGPYDLWVDKIPTPQAISAIAA